MESGCIGVKCKGDIENLDERADTVSGCQGGIGEGPVDPRSDCHWQLP